MDAPPSYHSRRRSTSSVGGGGINGGNTHGHRRARSELVLEAQSEREEDHTGGLLDDSDRTDSSDFELDELAAEEGLEDDEETGLTLAERRKRRRRKRRNTRLDERVAGDIEGAKAREQLAKFSVLKASIINGTLIALWYVLPFPAHPLHDHTLRNDLPGTRSQS